MLIKPPILMHSTTAELRSITHILEPRQAFLFASWNKKASFSLGQFILDTAFPILWRRDGRDR
jgi:hypothetical protein